MLIIQAADWLTKILMVLAAFLAFCLCFIVLGDILLRATDNPITGTKEIIANSVVIIVFMQLGYAIRSGSMLRADFVVLMFGPRMQKALKLLAYVLGALFFLFLLDAAVPHAIRSFTRGEVDGVGVIRVPVWPARWTIVLGSALAGINYILIAIIDVFDLRVKSLDEKA